MYYIFHKVLDLTTYVFSSVCLLLEYLAHLCIITAITIINTKPAIAITAPPAEIPVTSSGEMPIIKIMVEHGYNFGILYI